MIYMKLKDKRHSSPNQININAIYKILKKEFNNHQVPVVDLIQMQTKDPFKVLITTILSARTKDNTTSEAASRLFADISCMDDLKKTRVKKLEKLIFPVGFYNNKAKYLKELPGVLDRLYDGVIPQTVEELVKLPGVGRKTANLVVAVAFNKPAICVDVHVHRICNRLGYVTTKTPFETEMTLREILPKKYWITINSYLVSFGQHLCFPINPRCDRCPIYTFCRKINVITKYSCLEVW